MKTSLLLSAILFLFPLITLGQEKPPHDQVVWLYHADIQYEKMHIRGYLSITYSDEPLSQCNHHPDTMKSPCNDLSHQPLAQSYYRTVIANPGNQFVDLVIFPDSIHNVYWAPGLKKAVIREKIGSQIKEIIEHIRKNQNLNTYTSEDPALNLSMQFKLPEKSTNP